MKTDFFKSNGASKNPFFRTDFKNVHMTLVKSAPKKSFCQIALLHFYARHLGVKITGSYCSVLEDILVVLLLDDGVGEDGSQILRDGPLPPEGDLEQEDDRQGHHRADHGPAHADHDPLKKSNQGHQEF
jgi:hypothetical protein